VERQDRLTDREAIIVRYAPLVKYVVGRLAISLPAVIDYDDLLGYGTLGLIDAVDRFDPAQLVKFETDAVTRIRGYIIDQLRALDWIPRSARQRGREIERASTQFKQEQGRPAKRQDIAVTLGLDPAQVAQAQVDAACTTISLDVAERTSHDGSELNLLDMIEDADSPSPAVVAEQNDLRLSLRAAVAQLPERERHLISLYYGDSSARKGWGAHPDQPRYPRRVGRYREGRPLGEAVRAPCRRLTPALLRARSTGAVEVDDRVQRSTARSARFVERWPGADRARMLCCWRGWPSGPGRRSSESRGGRSDPDRRDAWPGRSSEQRTT